MYLADGHPTIRLPVPLRERMPPDLACTPDTVRPLLHPVLRIIAAADERHRAFPAPPRRIRRNVAFVGCWMPFIRTSPTITSQGQEWTLGCEQGRWLPRGSHSRRPGCAVMNLTAGLAYQLSSGSVQAASFVFACRPPLAGGFVVAGLGSIWLSGSGQRDRGWGASGSAMRWRCWPR